MLTTLLTELVLASIQKTSQLCGYYFHLHRINQIKRYVDQDCLRSLVHAFITSRLDYCNSLYSHCNRNVSSRQRLQRVQNRAACLVLNVLPHTLSLPLLQQLHWLPIQARISYKLCFLMYRVTNGTAPLYLVELLSTLLRHASASRSD